MVCARYVYDTLLGLTREEIEAEIRRIKRRITYLKAEVLLEDLSGEGVCPSTWLRLAFLREELEDATKAYVDTGYEIKFTSVEKGRDRFQEDFKRLKNMTFSRTGTDKEEVWSLQFLRKRVKIVHNDRRSGRGKVWYVPKGELIDLLRQLHIEEWRRRYRAFVPRGEKWSLIFIYGDGTKRRYDGVDAYPFSYFRLIEVLENACSMN